MDAIFKALNDSARRDILDSLRRQDGQTLTELEQQFEMSRFGVMKHLRVLEDANLIITRKQGRFKYHYLNSVPLQQVIDRWIEPLLAKPAARALLDLKSHLEGSDAMSDKPDLMLTTYIDCSHDALWDALTKGDMIAKYHFASPHITGDYATGGQVCINRPDGTTMLTNTVTLFDPKSRIDMTFALTMKDQDIPASRCVYLVEPTNSGMKLTVEHYDLPPGMDHTRDGWSRFLASLKTFLETGKTPRFSPQAG